MQHYNFSFALFYLGICNVDFMYYHGLFSVFVTQCFYHYEIKYSALSICLFRQQLQCASASSPAARGELPLPRDVPRVGREEQRRAPDSPHSPLPALPVSEQPCGQSAAHERVQETPTYQQAEGKGPGDCPRIQSTKAGSLIISILIILIF